MMKKLMNVLPYDEQIIRDDEIIKFFWCTFLDKILPNKAMKRTMHYMDDEEVFLMISYLSYDLWVFKNNLKAHSGTKLLYDYQKCLDKIRSKALQVISSIRIQDVQKSRG